MQYNGRLGTYNWGQHTEGSVPFRSGLEDSGLGLSDSGLDVC